MRWFAILPLAGCLLATALLAPVTRADDKPAAEPPSSQPVAVDVSDKAALEANMNKDVVVEGVVDSARWSSSGKVVALEFKKAADSKFMAVAFVRHRDELDKAFSGDFARSMAGARVRIRGTLKDYKGRPEIVIDSPAQVTVLEPAPPKDG
jgi:DNA/RNA endonuclease YhcR with UshA esterase domain